MRTFLLAALSGLLYCLAFPPIDLGMVAWVALVPLVIAARASGVLRGAFAGWIAGTIACNGLTSPSIMAALLRAGHPSWLAGMEAFVIPQICGALYFAAFGACVAIFRKREPPAVVACVVLAAAWVAGELARSRVGYGMPWVLLAHSQTAMPAVLQVADLVGAYGVSFLVALVNVAVASIVRPARTAERWQPAILATVVGGTVLAYGFVQLGRWHEPGGRPLDVALVQGAIPETWRASLARLPDVLGRYGDLVATAMTTRPDLVILPENAAGVAAEADPRLIQTLVEPLGGTRTALVFGAPRTVLLAPNRATTRNAAYLVDASGAIGDTYDKHHLVPFGEASTWLLPSVLARRLGIEDAYSPGNDSVLFRVGGVPFATFICWEGIYATTSVAAVRGGATFLVNLSNDDWFDGRAAREQHFRATLLRAVETRRFLLRVTNSGVTAVVDPRGVVVATVPLDRPGVVPARIVAASDRSLYVRTGDLFGWLCVVVTLAMCGAGVLTKRVG